MAFAEVNWNSIVSSLYTSKGSLPTKFDIFKQTLLDDLQYKTARCYIIHESGTYFRPVEFKNDRTVIGWSELRRPEHCPNFWEIELEHPVRSFPDFDICDRYIAIVTIAPTGNENGIVLIGYDASQNQQLEQQITSCSASFIS